MKRAIALTVLLIPTVCLCLACQSRFEETTGSGETVSGKSKVEAELTNKSIAEKILKAQEVIDALGYAVDQITLGTKQLNSSSAVLSLILEASSVAHTKSLQNNKYVADSEVILPAGLTTDNCRLIKIHSEYSRSEKEAELKLSVLTCRTNGQYEELVSLVGNAEGKVSIISKRDYSQTLPDIDGGDFLNTQNCSVVKDGKNLSEISCQAADLKLNDSEKVIFSDLSYKADRDPQFRLEASLHKDGIKKDSYTVEISKDGKVTAKVNGSK